ncbi:MAG: aspartate/glutamate racemase family protein [Candidatus Bathyarchaeia archaeon]
MKSNGPRILVININTTESFTKKIEKAAKAYARPGTEIIAVTATRGTPSMEDFYDEYLSTVGVIESAKKVMAKEKIDSIILGCAADAGLYALKEAFDIPAIGLVESMIGVANILGYKFSILTFLNRFVPHMELLIRKYGQESRCASIRSIDMTVLDIGAKPNLVFQKLEKEGRKAVEEDAADVILFGCTGMSDLDKKLEKKLGVPVLDGYACAVKMAEAIYDYKLKPSKTHLFKKSEPKEVIGYPDILQPK